MHYILIISLLHLAILDAVLGFPLDGAAHPCRREGEMVELKKLLHVESSCAVCYCQNHVVQCRKKEQCHSIAGCYRLQPKEPNDCCRKCQGCLVNNKEVSHGMDWHHGCRHYQCQAGVLTATDAQCYVPCARPSPPTNGSCCPRCEGCWLEGKHINEGDTSYPMVDPCVKCTCIRGKLECRKKTCPVLSCPKSKEIPDEDGCCFKCEGYKTMFRPRGGKCFLGTQLYYPGENKTHDHCTTCTCAKGLLTCYRQSCPPLQCPEMYQQSLAGQCCPRCIYPTRSQVCIAQGVLRDHGDKWKLDQCSTCRCRNGQVLCQFDPCEDHEASCGPGFKKILPKGACCPQCVSETPGVCVTYGDPHYRTFDNHLFNFQGECRYELARDCRGRKFSVRVNNDARRSSFFSWTRSLSIKVNVGHRRYKVSLGQKLRTKVDRKRVKLPFEDIGIAITRKGYALQVKTSIGLKVIWDGASYVEVHVDGDWRGRTCGLCGNFNGNVSDDRAMRNGPLAHTDEDMANSWLSGKARSCRRRLNERIKKSHGERSVQKRAQRLTCINSGSEAIQRCQGLNHTYFSQCHRVVDVGSFYSSCLLDLCECPSPRICECDSLVAYVRECERAGIHLDSWRNVSKCGGFECPHGATYMPCAPACKPTCKNPFPNPRCHMKNCKPNCYCPPSTVLHRGVCISPNKCPQKKRKRRRRT